jgi:cytochrome b pre-mRNA-processing protein 3
MVLERLFARRPAKAAGLALYASAARQSRRPGFYTRMGAPDTAEGRFEVYSLHVVLLLHRLKGEGEQAKETSQATFDAFVQALDDALREMGVGDVIVPKKMRRLGAAFYGRVKAYEDALALLPATDELTALVARTILLDVEAGDAAALAAYAAEASAWLAAIPTQDLLQGQANWPEVTS